MIGILGGVGSGKSSVARHVRGAVVIDADRVGHELLQTDAVRNRIVEEFGSSVLSNHGVIDRSKLAAMVFGNDQTTEARRTRLEQILHPEIRRATEQQISSVPDGTLWVIIDAALLLEAGWQHRCDAIVFVDTPLEKRRQRVAANRNWNTQELERREQAQLSLKEKRRRADLIIDNSEQLEQAVAQLEEWLAARDWDSRSSRREHEDSSPHSAETDPQSHR